MVRILVALGLSLVSAFTLLFTAPVSAKTNSDALQLISLTTAMMAKQRGAGSPEIHVTKIALTDRYAVVDWTQGHASGDEVFQKRYLGGWKLIGSGSAASQAALVDYGVAPTTAIALVGAIKHCLSPQKVTFHGRATSVCLVGPCAIC